MSTTGTTSTGEMPVTTLTTGVRVANFSSPHTFTFTDGSVLPACSDERSRALMLRAVETEVAREGWIDIRLQFKMSPVVLEALSVARHAHEIGDVDLVIVPFPVMTALKAVSELVGPFRTVRMADRVKKIAHHDRFCL